jgi:hypothetical protein
MSYSLIITLALPGVSFGVEGGVKGPTTNNKFGEAPVIKASAGKDCFGSLEPKDMENLGGILYVRDNVIATTDPENIHEFEAKRKRIDATFSGEKREAAYAVLAMSMAKANEARMTQVVNQALSRGEARLNDSDKKLIAGLLKESKEKGIDLEAALNSKIATSVVAAETLKAKGAKILSNGQWQFDKNFNFNEAKTNPEFLNALKTFFPKEMEELSGGKSGYVRGYTVIGNMAVVHDFEGEKRPSKKEDNKMYLRSMDLESHTKRTVQMIDSYMRVSADYARLSKKINHWASRTVEILDTKMCGVSMLDVGMAPLTGLLKVGNYMGMTPERPRGDVRVEQLERQKKEYADQLDRLRSNMLRHGIDVEAFNGLQDVMTAVLNQEGEDLEKGFEGAKKAMTAIAFSPALVLTAPISLPAAGASMTAATLAYAGAALTVASIVTPIAIAGRNVYQAVKNGDGLLCSMVKHGAQAPVTIINDLKWGALAPGLKTLVGADKIAALVAKLGPNASKLAVFIPTTAMSGWKIWGAGNEVVTQNEAIANIEKALKDAKALGNTRHAAVLEIMLTEAKDGRWSAVLEIASSSVDIASSIHDIAQKNPAESKEAGEKKTEEKIEEKVADKKDSLDADKEAPKSVLDADKEVAETKNRDVASAPKAADAAAPKEIKLQTAQKGDSISTQINEIHPGQPNVGKTVVNVMADDFEVKAQKEFPNLSKKEAILKFVQASAIKKPLLVDVMSDGTLLLKDGHHRASAYQVLIDRGLLDPNEFKPKLVVGNNFQTDTKFSGLSKDAAMEAQLTQLYKENAIYLPPEVRKLVDAKKISVTEAFKNTIPESFDKVGDQMTRSLMGGVHYELGVPGDNLINFMEFYSAEKLTEFGINLPKNYDAGDVSFRTAAMKEIVKSPKYFEYLKQNIRPGLSPKVQAETIAKIDLIKKRGHDYLSRVENVTDSIKSRNPSKAKIIDDIPIPPFNPDISPKEWEGILKKHAEKIMESIKRAPASSGFFNWQQLRLQGFSELQLA